MKYSSRQVITAIIQKEIGTYLRSKATIFSVAVIAILGVAAIFIISALQNRDGSDTQVGIVGIDQQYFETAATMTNADDVETVALQNIEVAQQQLDDEEIDAFLVATPDGFEYHSPDAPSTAVSVVMETGVNLWAQDTALQSLNISANEFYAAYPATEIIPVDTSAQETDFEAVAGLLIMISIVFFFIASFAGVLGSRVTEEKSSHVVSLLVAAARPIDILVGKLVGNLIFGTVSTTALALLFFGSYKVSDLSGSIEIPANTIALSTLIFVLAMLFFGSLYAASGAMVARTEDLQSTQSPVLILMLGAGYSAFFGVSNLDSTLMTTLSWIPPFSIFTAPLQYVAGNFNAAEFWGSYAIAFITTCLILVLSARIYKIGILRSGTKMSWLSAFKK